MAETSTTEAVPQPDDGTIARVLRELCGLGGYSLAAAEDAIRAVGVAEVLRALRLFGRIAALVEDADDAR